MHIHRYKFVGEKGPYYYYQCRCGDRRVHGGLSRGYAPYDHDWVIGKTNDLYRKVFPPPPTRIESEPKLKPFFCRIGIHWRIYTPIIFPAGSRTINYTFDGRTRTSINPFEISSGANICKHCLDGLPEGALIDE